MTTPSADRRSISSQRVWLLTALVGVQLWVALSSLPSDPQRRTFAAEAATLCAVLAMFGLRSVPLRWIVRGLTLMSGLLLARFGELGQLDGVQGSWRVLLWLIATAAALALSPSSRSIIGHAPEMVVHAEDVPPPADTAAGRRTTVRSDVSADASLRRRTGVPVALVVAAVSLIGATSLLIGPRVSHAFPVGASAGDLADLSDNRSDNALVAQDRLDMTRRPALTPRVVMSVRSSIASFWRAETYDIWDGASWTRSVGRGGTFLDNGRVRPSPDDLAARLGEESEQEFRIEIGFATAVPSAATPVQVDSTHELAQRPDGTLVAVDQPLSRGTTYTVTSRQVPTDPDQLAATDHADVPESVLAQYASTPIATDRTVELVEEVTAGLGNDYDKVRALEEWMNDNTTYSLDAPLAPQGVDVVDHFLFESRQGWCEQIASSLVVMSRLAGVPARLTTGYAPGEWDPVGGRFVVRERDAHAWAEVWFPDHGWVTFDPTAVVPLAGTAEATPGAAAVDWREIAGAVLAAVGVVALSAAPVSRFVRRRSDRLRTRRTQRVLERTRWDVAEERRIERLGAQAGRPREPAETVSAYAGVLADALGDASLADTGERVDRHRYGPPS